MPTYKKRSGVTGIVVEHGVAVYSATQTVPTKKILTETRIEYESASGTFIIGETITESVSGATGELLWDNGSIFGLRNCSATAFTGGKTLTGTDSTETATGGTAYNLLTKTADTPVYSVLLHTHSVSSTGASDQTVEFDGYTRWVVITNVVGATITVNNFVAGNILQILTPGSSWSWYVDAKACQFILSFAATGTCTVYEFDTQDDPLR